MCSPVGTCLREKIVEEGQGSTKLLFSKDVKKKKSQVSLSLKSAPKKNQHLFNKASPLSPLAYILPSLSLAIAENKNKTKGVQISKFSPSSPSTSSSKSPSLFVASTVVENKKHMRLSR